MNKVYRVSLMIIFLTVLAFASSQAYTISIVPQFPRLVLFEDWQPLLDYLAEEIGAEFELQVEDDIPTFEEAFLEGEPDFAFMNPYHAVMAMNAAGYMPLLSDASRQLKGILVVRGDSSFESVQELNGSTLVFPAPNAFGASLYMRALLAEQEGIEFTAKYVDTHSNSYRHTVLGQAAAGGGVWNTFNKEAEGLKSQMRVLYETPGVTPHPFTAHPRVPEDVRTQVVEAILKLSATEEGRVLLKSVQMSEPMIVTYDEHYASLDALNLQEYIVLDD